MTDLRAIIVKRREQIGMSVSELARRAEVSRPNLSEYFHGRCDLNGTTIGKLFDVLGLEPTSSKGKK